MKFGWWWPSCVMIMQARSKLSERSRINSAEQRLTSLQNISRRNLGSGTSLMRAWMMCFFWLFLAGSIAANPQPYKTIPVAVSGGRVQFSVASTFADIVGTFRTWQTSLKMPGGKFVDASLNLQIAAGSVSTGSGFRDRLAKGKNFFAAQQYPNIRFISTKVTRGTDPSKFQMQGNLTVRGITRPVTVSITLYPPESGQQRIEGYFLFNRRQFGITHNMAFNRISNLVKVKVDLDVDYDSLPVAQN